jgi:hypothetical protein
MTCDQRQGRCLTIHNAKRATRASWTIWRSPKMIHVASFFNWVNRLMLSPGEPAATVGV